MAPPLLASTAFDFHAVAALASKLTRREVAHVTMTDEQHRETPMPHHLPGHAAGGAGLCAAGRKGEFTAVDPTLVRLQTLRKVLAAHLSDETTSALHPAHPWCGD